MANKVIPMQQIRSLIHLLEKGYSLRAISAQIGLSRQPVTIYATRLKNAPYSFEALRKLTDEHLASIVYPPVVEKSLSENVRRQELDVRMPYFLSELTRTGVTRLLLWEEYRKESIDPFRYTQFCILLKQASKITNASMHLVHAPAAMVMVDFAGDKMSYVDRSTGEVIYCPVLVAVLPFSKYTFTMALPDASIPQVIKALNGCMVYFGGVPLSLKTDNTAPPGCRQPVPGHWVAMYLTTGRSIIYFPITSINSKMVISQTCSIFPITIISRVRIAINNNIYLLIIKTKNMNQQSTLTVNIILISQVV